MTETEFTNRIDGLINDYEGGISTSKELRNGILDTLIELISKVSLFEARLMQKIAGLIAKSQRQEIKDIELLKREKELESLDVIQTKHIWYRQALYDLQKELRNLSA
jgi:hypothetical protein